MRRVQLETRIQGLLDGTLPEDQVDALKSELSVSEEARRLYVQYARLHTALQFRSKEIQSLEKHSAKVTPFKKKLRKAPIRKLVAIAAAIALAGVPAVFLYGPKRPALAVFQTAPGTLYSLTHTSNFRFESDLLLDQGSRLTVTQGSVEIDFTSGVKSVLTAPSTILLKGAAHLYMDEGEAWFKVPEAARGFRVETDEQDIIDLGTVFGVRATAAENETHVIEGVVKVTSRAQSSAQEALSAGEARKTDASGNLVKIPYDPAGFLSALPSEIVRYEGALDVREGTRSLGKGGLSYTISRSVNTEPNVDGYIGELVLNENAEQVIQFSRPVDLYISAPGRDIFTPSNENSPIWNSIDDYGHFTCAAEAEVSLTDPNNEIRLEKLSPGRYRWEFLSENTAENRFASKQKWEIKLGHTDRFSISKGQESQARTALRIGVISPSKGK